MDYAPFWIPIVVALLFMLIFSMFHPRTSPAGCVIPLLKEMIKDPWGCIKCFPGAVFILWVMGVGVINFGLGLWYIHFKLKGELVGLFWF